MINQTIADFQHNVLKKMTFTPHKMGHAILYKNDNRPELGYFLKYSRKGCYEFGVGDYTIPADFSLAFEHHEALVRFGTVYTGETHFKIEGYPVSSFTPSSFFVVEKALKGRQSWQKGRHFHGVELTIYKSFFDDVLLPNFPECMNFDNFITNHTYHYLPLDVACIIQDLKSLAEQNRLSPLYLESKVLEALALISQEIASSPQNTFTSQINHGKIKIGKERYVHLTASDIHALQKAHTILTNEACNPPTIKALSKMVFLNEQKLKAGFSAKYHMSISQYTTALRMAKAENLLATTDLSIEEIAKQLGYHYSGSFIKMFKQIHGQTPLAFRKLKK